ncbi:MAG TPA: pentapeptide repeat-containing protein [Anaerolineae bacterium]
MNETESTDQGMESVIRHSQISLSEGESLWTNLRKQLVALGFWLVNRARNNPLGSFIIAILFFLFAWLLWETVKAQNTGFEKRTLWDWLDKLVAPVVVAIAAWWLNRLNELEKKSTARIDKLQEEVRERELAAERLEEQRNLAIDLQQQTLLETYFGHMTELLLDRGLRSSKRGDEVTDEVTEVKGIARARTLALFWSLNGKRKGLVLRFLYDLRLLYQEYLVDLRGADLSSAELTGVRLHSANLREVNLSAAHLRGSGLNGVFFIGANLQNADLQGADLRGADLNRADLKEARLNDAKLHSAKLDEALLNGAELARAELDEASLVKSDLRYAKLNNANLNRTNLTDSFLDYADLSAAILSNAFLNNTDLTGATLDGTDLRGADLTGAKITIEQINEVKTIEDATMPDGTKDYGKWTSREYGHLSRDGLISEGQPANEAVETQEKLAS